MIARHLGIRCALLVAATLVTVPPAAATGIVVEWRRAPAAGRGSVAAVLPLGADAPRLGVVSARPLFAGHTAPADPLARFWLVEAAPDRDTESVLAALNQHPAVAGAEADILMPLEGCLPDDPYFAHSDPDSAQWPLYGNPSGPDLNAIEAWNATPGDTSVIIAVLDSGVDWHHPDFGPPASPAGTIHTNWAEAGGQPGVDDDHNGFVDDIRGWDFVDVSTIPGETGKVDPQEDGFTPDNDPSDYIGHGTFVAGIVGARADDGQGMAGAAPGCRLMPLRVAWREDYIAQTEPPQHVVADVVSMTFAAQAIVYAADNGARVLNCSWLSDQTTALAAALDHAIGTKKVVVVDAAGNGFLVDTQRFNYLSRRGDCIEVAACARSGEVSPVTCIGAWVDISAPGDSILSLVKTGGPRLHRLFTGGATSFATPYVAAAAGLVLSLEPALTAAQVRQRIMDTATPIYQIGVNYYYAGRLGAGLVNLAGAVDAAHWSHRRLMTGGSITAPAVLADGSLVTTTGGHLISYNPNLAASFVAPLPLEERPTGLAAMLSGGTHLRAVSFLPGHVALVDILGRAEEGWPRPTGGLLPSEPVLVDLDGQGHPAVIVAGTDSMLYVWDRHGTPPPGFPMRVGDAALVSPAAGDLDGDGGLDIVCVTRDGQVEVFDRTGSRRLGWPLPTPLKGAGAWSPLLADLDGDGRLEIVVPGGARGLYAFKAGGQALAASWPVALPAPLVGEPAAADLDGDGQAEVLCCTQGGTVLAIRGDGSAAPGWPVTLPAEPAAGPLALVVDGGARPAMVVATRDGCLHAVAADGRPVRGWPKRHDGTLHLPPAAGGSSAQPTGAGVWLIDGKSGDRRFRLPDSGATDPMPWSALGGNPARTRCLKASRPPAAAGKEAARPPRLALSPNPSAGGAVEVGFRLETAGTATLDVYDVQGRLVRRMPAGVLAAGEQRVVWDGRDSRGRTVAAGIYAVRLEAGNQAITGRLVRLW